jgi:hypothetical protein
MPSFKNIFIKRLFPLICLNIDKKISELSQADFDVLKHKITNTLTGFQNRKIFNIEEEIDMKNLRYNICEFIYYTGACVTGSFMLDCLYNTNYHNDIDIYDLINITDNEIKNTHYTPASVLYSFKPNDNKLPFTKFIYASGFRWRGFSASYGSNGDGYIRTYLPNEIQQLEMNSSEEELHECGEIDCLSINKHKIQIIPVKLKKSNDQRSPIRTFINSYFDLDICKNYFNGRELIVRSWKKLIYKYDYIKNNIHGIVYDDGAGSDDNYDDMVKNIFDVDTTEKRMKKYIERGFNIKVHPQQDKINNYVIRKFYSEPDPIARCIRKTDINLDQFYIE